MSRLPYSPPHSEEIKKPSCRPAAFSNKNLHYFPKIVILFIVYNLYN